MERIASILKDTEIGNDLNMSENFSNKPFIYSSCTILPVFPYLNKDLAWAMRDHLSCYKGLGGLAGFVRISRPLKAPRPRLRFFLCRFLRGRFHGE